MSNKKPFQRRTESESLQAGDYFTGAKRYYDQVSEHTIVKIYSGDFYVTEKPGELLVTVLGSCVAACIRDPIVRVGGMNHFLLPDCKSEDLTSTRYGAFAMEELINGILKLGGKKNRLEVKLFGGSNVIKSSALIGSRNIEFVRNYLKNESIPIASEHLGGKSPRRVHYYPDTGKVMMRELHRQDDFKQVTEEEKSYQHTLEDKTKVDTIGGEVELF